MIYCDIEKSLKENLEIFVEYFKDSTNINNLPLSTRSEVRKKLHDYFKNTGLYLQDDNSSRWNYRIIIKSLVREPNGSLLNINIIIQTLFSSGAFNNIKLYINYCGENYNQSIKVVNSYSINEERIKWDHQIKDECVKLQHFKEVTEKYNIDLDDIKIIKSLPDIMRFNKESLIKYYPEYCI